MDQTINARGVQVDVQTLDAALDILGQAERRYTMELANITQGAVGSVSEVAKFVDWLNASGARFTNLQADTVEEALKTGVDVLGAQLSPPVRRALEIRSTLGAANVKKLRTLRLQVSSDGRLRNQYTYCGADRTGRWSAGGVQLQNITAKGPATSECEACGHFFGVAPRYYHEGPGCPRCGAWLYHALPKGEWPIEAVEDAISDIRGRSLDWVEQVWGDPIAVLCGILRGLFVAAEGRKLVCCDFSAIEAVAAACLAREDWRIRVFEDPGECIYTQSAAKITGTPLETYQRYKADNGGHHPDRKKIGKVAELASGYGGWINAWKAFGCEMSDDDIKAAVLKWREESPAIVYMWGGQFVWCGPGKWDYRPELHGLEGAFIQAVQNPGQWFGHHDIGYFYDQAVDCLFARLPSGRFLHYHRPRLTPTADKLNRGPAVALSFEGWNSNSAKGPVGWVRMETFGGRLFENKVQAVAYDIQAEALQRCEANGYPIVMHTHDEGTAEVPNRPEWNVKAMAAVIAERPTWASWWPLRAAGWEHKRYQKD